MGDSELDAFKTLEATGWERQARTYGDVVGRVTRRLVDPLLDAAGVGPGRRVLDLATGPGYAAAAAVARGADVVAVDIAPAMVELARRLHPGLDVRLADAEALPFQDADFDAAVSNFVVPHLGRHDTAVAELVRVLRPGGRLALTTWDTPDRARLQGVFLEAFAAAGAGTPVELRGGPPFFRYADEGLFIELLEDAGLVDVQGRSVAFDHEMASPDELWDGMLGGTVRTSALLLAQPNNVRAQARAAFDRQVEDYRRGDHLELPISVKLAFGRKPTPD
jgi:SAM-dependent methyltransferase